MLRNYARMTSVFLVTLILVSLFATGCQKAQEEKVIMFGAALPLTGPLSPEGKKHIDGYNIWKDTVNEKGGIDINGEKYKVDIKFYDYKSDTATAVKLVEKLITEDGIQLIFGPFGSGQAKACSAVTEKYGVPMIAPSASAEGVYDQGYKYIFGTFTPDRTLTEPLADLAMAQEDPPKTIAIIARNDLFPLSIATEAKNSAEKRGIEVLAFEQYAIGTTDFSPTLIQLKALNADWIFATGYINDLIQIGKQMKELGVKAKMISKIAGPVYQEYIDGLGKDADNITTACWWSNYVEYQGEDIFGTAENFTKLFKEKYGYTPDYPCASAATVGVIFQKAIESTGSTDPKVVRDAIASSDFMTFWGPIKFDERGMMASLQPPVLQIQNQEIKVLHPANIKQADLIYPMPGWQE